MIYGYMRVSTEKQSVENQRFEIEEFCKKNNISIDGWMEETISGNENYVNRKLGELINFLEKGDTIICIDLRRLSRDKDITMEILNILKTKEINLLTIRRTISSWE